MFFFVMLMTTNAFAQSTDLWTFKLQTRHGVSVQTVRAPNQFVAKDLAQAIAKASNGRILGNVKKISK